MTRDEALKRLRPCEPELRASGLAALYLFGSTARNEAVRDSDLDLLFELGDVPKFSLLDQCAIQIRLEELLNISVDLVERDSLRPRIKARVEPEMVRIF
jgi:predicted nucleotidyltransferase